MTRHQSCHQHVCRHRGESSTRGHRLAPGVPPIPPTPPTPSPTKQHRHNHQTQHPILDTDRPCIAPEGVRGLHLAPACPISAPDMTERAGMRAGGTSRTTRSK
eukprot:3935708-Rhodomonas_salina.1